MMKYLKLMFVVVFLFIACVAQNTPVNKDYLRIQWENPVGSSPITHYDVYRFPSADDTVNTIKILSHTYNDMNAYNTCFDSLPHNDTLFFRVKSVNQYGESPFSYTTYGYIDDNLVPIDYVLTDSSIQLRWESEFPGEDTHRWLKVVPEEEDSLLSLNPEYYVDLGISDTQTVIVELRDISPNINYYYFPFETRVSDGFCVSGDMLYFIIETYPSRVLIIRNVK